MDGSHVLTESHQLAVKDDRRAVGSLLERQEASGTRSCGSPPIFISPSSSTRAARAYHFTRPPIFLMTKEERDRRVMELVERRWKAGEKVPRVDEIHDGNCPIEPCVCTPSFITSPKVTEKE